MMLSELSIITAKQEDRNRIIHGVATKAPLIFSTVITLHYFGPQERIGLESSYHLSHVAMILFFILGHIFISFLNVCSQIREDIRSVSNTERSTTIILFTLKLYYTMYTRTHRS